MVFLDLRLGKVDGMKLIPALLTSSPWLKIVVITAYASIETAVEAIKNGATDYMAKPFSPSQVRLMAQRIEKVRELERENAFLKEIAQGQGSEVTLQSKNPGMRRLIETLNTAAISEAIILFQGESGTGKSLYAQAVHRWSKRSAKPFGVVACPAVPSELLESELFGHVKGAFTGAIKDNQGRIAACAGGTLFLDEIGDMPLQMQAKLLRFIQDKVYERLGDSTSRKADVRIVAATNTDLEKRVAEGQFREDLFYRLNVISVTMPPLRERKEDILPMASDFLAYFCNVNHKKLDGFSNEAEIAVRDYSWPGNIRELRNAIERAVILSGAKTIQVDDLPHIKASSVSQPSIGDNLTLAEIEELHIKKILSESSSLHEAAKTLGIDQATLWRRRKSYGI
jgi:NtrC-family two-component system response regulator AlgB